MDNVCHTFAGAALAATGLRRASALATAALVIGANLPDADVLAYVRGEYFALAFRRGITHGLPAVAAWTLLLAGGLLAWDARVRRRREPAAPPARAAPLLGVCLLGVLSHPALDWLNNYGMRWLLPFDGRWSYGDAVFIVDPWLWLLLGGAAFLVFSAGPRGLLAWAATAAAASAPVLLLDVVPTVARVVWLAGLAALAAWRAWGGRGEAGARALVATAAAYALLLVGLDGPERRVAEAALSGAGVGPVLSVAVTPVPARPLRGLVVAGTPDGYRLGELDWLADEPVAATSPLAGIPLDPATAAAPIAAALEVPRVRDFLVWSRYPYARAEARPGGGWVVTIGDARYGPGTGGLAGLSVALDADLEPLEDACCR